MKTFSFIGLEPRIIDKNRSTSSVGGFLGSDAPTEIRTPVLTLKGLRPGPLDDGGGSLSGGILSSTPV